MRRLLGTWEEVIAALALAVVFLSVVWGVIARYIAPQPAAWSNELATIGFAWLVFIGAAAAAKRRLHVGVDMVTARLSPPIRHGLAIVVATLLAIVLAYVAFLAVRIGLASLHRPTPVLRLPTTVVHAAVAIGFASMSAQSATEALRLIRTGGKTPA
jgi:TRAP-type C4-dicarboxylate transport system permease small subunit